MGETETDTEKKRVANHLLLDAAGAEVDAEELATGFRYHHIGSGSTFDFQTGMDPGKMQTMLCIFGGKTLATNEASAVRQKEGDTGDQVGAIRERFAGLATGKWVDRTREGPKVDKGAMTDAALQVLVDSGKIAQDAVAAKRPELLAKMDDPKFIAQIRQVQGVAAAYAKLVGKATKTADDLATMVG